MEQPFPITPMFKINVFKILSKYDIIHMWVPYYLTNLAIIFMKLFYPRKKLILTMDTLPGYSFSIGKKMDNLFVKWNKMFGWLIFKKPDKITLYGRSLVKYALKAGVSPNKIQVIPTGISLSKKSASKDIRKECNISDKTKILLYVGLLNSRKGVDIILKTTKRLVKHNIKTIIVGDGPCRQEFEVLAKKLGLINRIIFTGFRRDVKDFYKSADIFFFPSRGEGLPGVVMESMVFKLPVVTTDIPCTTDLIQDGKSGFLCKIDDVDDFSEKILRLIKENSLRKSFAEEAYQQIKHYDWKHVLSQYEKLYEEI